MKVIIGGGGTGGHIFPAISIANALREADESVEILFVGANGKIEMEKVPAAGYKIEGLPVAGFQRRLTWRNIQFPFKLVYSLWRADSIVRNFKPDVAVGVGGYASGPVLQRAAAHGVPCLLQEQNSLPGVTNRLLADKANRICVAYPNMERFFPREKIILTGNPIRQNLTNEIDQAEARKSFGLDPMRPTILVIGGSLGARSINNGLRDSIDEATDDVQMIWQTGSLYYEEMKAAVEPKHKKNVVITAFVRDMDKAYAAADVVVSRAGAGSISELAMLGKACILVPSPNVSEDHQTKNARALENEGAAVMVVDSETNTLIARAKELLNDKDKMESLRGQILSFARPNAARDIAREVMALVQKSNQTD